MKLHFFKEEKEKVNALGKVVLGEIEHYLDEIEDSCIREFYNIPNQRRSFDTAWRLYCENAILGYCDEKKYGVELDEYLEGINNEDFVNWLMNT